MNRRTAYKLRQLGIIIVVWLIIGFIIPFYDRLALVTMNAVPPAPRYTMLEAVLINMGAAFTGALLGGSFLVFYVNVRFRDKSYGYTDPGSSRRFPPGDRHREHPAAPV